MIKATTSWHLWGKVRPDKRRNRTPTASRRVMVLGGLSSAGGLCLVLVCCMTMMIFKNVEGLVCYECLSLDCDSGAVCSSIRDTMREVFVPKGHIIHFDPDDVCPEGEEPSSNSSKWANLSRGCQRSDSVCLVSPITILSSGDGSRWGKAFESGKEFTTSGLLRGCASRRNLQEAEDTIRVLVNLVSSSSRHRTPAPPPDTQNSTTNATSKVQEVTVEWTLPSPGVKYEDGYEISRIHSHQFLIDQGTPAGGTKCFEDNCNTKVRMRSGVGDSRSDSRSVLLSTMLILAIVK